MTDDTYEVYEEVRVRNPWVVMGRWLLLTTIVCMFLIVFVPDWDGAGGTTPDARCAVGEACFDCRTQGDRECSERQQRQIKAGQHPRP